MTTATQNAATSKLDETGITQIFHRHFKNLADLATLTAEHYPAQISRAVELLVTCLTSGGKVLACGNGGSAADAQHFVAELVGRVTHDRPPLAGVNLTCDGSILTALGNDYGYDDVFARQVQALGHDNDVLIVLSTSGRSPNVLRAVAAAKALGMVVLGLTGTTGDPCLEDCDVWFRIDSTATVHIQEIHTAVLHVLCLGIDHTLFGANGKANS